MATALYAVVDLRNLRLSTSCSGHLPPLLLHGDSVSQLECDSTIPLLVTNVTTFPCVERSISPGDRVLFYTDGITEREDDSENMYQVDRLMDTFHALRAASPQELIDALVADGARFAGGREPADDQTLLLMTVRE
jgi:sigma-B regulation protein RsbU (phosphoserine phosphatase)